LPAERRIISGLSQLAVSRDQAPIGSGKRRINAILPWRVSYRPRQSRDATGHGFVELPWNGRCAPRNRDLDGLADFHVAFGALGAG
jgi:hypothetical protein